MEYVFTHGLKIAQPLYDLARNEIVPGTSVKIDQTWRVLAELIENFADRNQQLLQQRDDLQAEIDQWLEERPSGIDPAASKEFLLKIGYLVPEKSDFQITTADADDEIATIAGPQLVVPLDNARYTLNAANARWGSLYDALYGTDLIPKNAGVEQKQSYNPKRGELVIAKANDFLDEALALQVGSWHQLTQLKREQGRLVCKLGDQLVTTIAQSDGFVGYQEQNGHTTSFLFKHHNLHIDILIDPNHPIGQQHPAQIKDVILESAVSTILDCEDSVAAVDAEDKAVLYRHWTQLMRGTLSTTFSKNNRQQTRTLNPNRTYLGADGQPLHLHGRSLLLIRHVGSHIYTNAVTTKEGSPIPETFLDAALTVPAVLHDLNQQSEYGNSRTGSMYIVKPKHHGPEEVQLSVDIFEHLEHAYGLPANTLKIGIMDEERRTTLNLKECIRVAKTRVIFINTGFLDRTGDEIHTSMAAGPMLPKPLIKQEPWISAYENHNVDVGLACGFQGKAQIGKGMWAEPDAMATMVASKIAHPMAGASCAWVPSPVAATLHATHYHKVSVVERQQDIKQRQPASLDDMLTPPLLGSRTLTAADIQQELDNNIQGILGYVVRWIDQGIGCSKVLDIHNIGLMEDRATLRISSQHVANWLKHGLTNQQQVLETTQRMAQAVDQQNIGEENYLPMAPAYEKSLAFQAAVDLIFGAQDEPNGYTEHILIKLRQRFKLSL